MISWSANTEDNGLPIESFTVKIQTKDGSYVEDPDCDGNNPEVILNKYCKVSMFKFTEEPYNLAKGDLIIAQVSA